MKKIAFLSLLFVALASSCVEDKMYEGPATISDVVYEPTKVTSDDAVTVTAKIFDVQGLTSANVVYTVNGAAQQSVAMTPVSNQVATYSATIPAQENKSVVAFYIQADNKAGFSVKSKESTYTVGDDPVDYTNLVLNELSPSGADNEKYFELYNKSDKAIILEGVTIMKDEELAWTGKKSQSIPAKGYFVILGGKGTTPDGFSTGFSGKKSVLIELISPEGTVVDKFQRGEKGTAWGGQSFVEVTTTFSRCPDGVGEWKVADHTRGTANPTSGVAIP